MTSFPQPPEDQYAVVVQEDTDRALPEKINQSTRYAYFKTIARGGKSIIQSCKDMHLGRNVVYKRLRPEFADDPIEQRRFLREARVSAMLQHPNTVPTYEVGRDNSGHYFFTMKLVHGYTLREIMDYRERYDLTRLIDVVIQIAQALQYAHSHRVVHRDIKPENILVGPFGETLLLDWGLAKVWNKDGSADAIEPNDPNAISPEEDTQTKQSHSITGEGKLQGTLAYMSPEQIQRDPQIDYRTDIFSLGVVLYEILAERPPASGNTVSALTEAILTGKPEPTTAFATYPVPPLLNQVAMKCIAKAPADRYQSCGALVRLLQENW